MQSTIHATPCMDTNSRMDRVVAIKDPIRLHDARSRPLSESPMLTMRRRTLVQTSSAETIVSTHGLPLFSGAKVRVDSDTLARHLAYLLRRLTLWVHVSLVRALCPFLVTVAPLLSLTLREASLLKRRLALQRQQVHTFSGHNSVIEST